MNIDEKFIILNKEYCKKNKIKFIKPSVGNSKYILNYKHFIKYYKKFFKTYKINGNMLDFGCGPGFAVYVGNLKGYNVIGLDVDQKNFDGSKFWRSKNDLTYSSIHKILEITSKIKFYDGHNIPFNDNNFDSILSNWSILFDYSISEGQKKLLDKFNNKRLKKRVIELIRISKKKAIWYISPKFHFEKIIKLFKKFNKKNIKIIYK